MPSPEVIDSRAKSGPAVGRPLAGSTAPETFGLCDGIDRRDFATLYSPPARLKLLVSLTNW
jgi:hypothetical protein